MPDEYQSTMSHVSEVAMIETKESEKQLPFGLKTVKIQRPLQVLSVQGRLFIDQIHRQAFTVFPKEENDAITRHHYEQLSCFRTLIARICGRNKSHVYT
mmetsp:Transcript_46047/g.67562  ORF Transcript_46047/g.67562 Transcript_46047/m.67562 type:complete len:99 (+) Transcript_46047:171-467(+)